MTRDEATTRFRHWAERLIAHHASTSTPSTPNAGEVYQVSTISALLDGVYDGDLTIAELLRHGDFGLGTFNHLDGEMVILDGQCYHLRADGTARLASPTDRTPFAAVMPFRTDFEIPVRTPTARADLLHTIDARLVSANLVHGIRIEGRFATVHTRTVMAQTKPYPPLTEATHGQAETTFEHVTGTLVGYRTPDFEQGISVAGYHLHFVNSAFTHGGHTLDFVLDNGQIAVSQASDLHLHLPTTGPFLRANLSSADLSEQIKHSEGSGD